MGFRGWFDHRRLKNQHSKLPASQNAWLNYTVDKLIAVVSAKTLVELGTRYHEAAAINIGLNIRLPEDKRTLNMYINDCINYRMDTEKTLYYSDRAFATADAISYRKKILRIHDLKTGHIPYKEKDHNQLKIYAAYFCLEYGEDPFKMKDIILSIYKNDEIYTIHGDPEEIKAIMDKIVQFDSVIEQVEEEMGANEH